MFRPDYLRIYSADTQQFELNSPKFYFDYFKLHYYNLSLYQGHDILSEYLPYFEQIYPNISRIVTHTLDIVKAHIDNETIVESQFHSKGRKLLYAKDYLEDTFDKLEGAYEELKSRVERGNYVEAVAFYSCVELDDNLAFTVKVSAEALNEDYLILPRFANF